jgi:RNA polymerase primary sigma factor
MLLREHAAAHLIPLERTTMSTVKERRRKASHGSPLECYLTEIDAAPLLSAAEERDLALAIGAGDLAARDRMVRANLRLVVNLARQYAGKGLPLEDVIAEGNLGLLRAVEGYDPAAGTRFSTYATFWIKQSIRRSLSADGRVVRLPHYVNGLLAKWRKASAALADDLGRAPADEEVAARLGLSAGELKSVRKAMRVHASFHAAAADAGGQSELAQTVVDGRSPAAVDRLSLVESVELALMSVDELNERETTVLRLRFGLCEEGPRTLQEVGERIGCTRERVRQIERDALVKLRDRVAA